MKKLPNGFRIIALLIMLIGWLLYHFHILGIRAMAILFIVAIVLSLAGVVITFKNIKKTAPKKTGLQKVSSNIIKFSGIGAIVALMLMTLHISNIGHPLLNGSLGLFIIGIIVLMASLPNANNTAVNPALRRQSIIYNTIICLGVICTVVGMILRINHYPYGKQIMFWSLAFVMVFLVFLIIHAMYTKKKSSL